MSDKRIIRRFWKATITFMISFWGGSWLWHEVVSSAAGEWYKFPASVTLIIVFGGLMALSALAAVGCLCTLSNDNKEKKDGN